MAAEVTDSIRTMDTLRWWEIHDKDSYTCPDCLRDPEEHPHQLEVHHVNKEPHKIVGLCAACHDIRHGADPHSRDLEFWKQGFLAL